jgi:zinc finger FYVE domain-containing protein 26
LNNNSSAGVKIDNLILINMIQELLCYAKIQFRNAANGTGGETLCDTFLSHVELLQSLLISKSLPPTFTFKDFSNPLRARQLRDKLISEDKMKLALNVATKCNIESEPVWMAWGMSLLKMGKYTDAKEKFTYCFGNEFMVVTCLTCVQMNWEELIML